MSLDRPEHLPDALRAAGLNQAASEIQVILEVTPGASQHVKGGVLDSGGRVEAEYGSLVQVLAPVSSVARLADQPGVTWVRLPYRGEPQAVTSEGVTWTQASTWQQAGFTGADVKVAIIDLGFSSIATRQSEGNLPANAVVRSFRADGNISAGSSPEHGTACAEIVYDMAPGAQLYLVNYGTDVELGNAVDWLISQGVNVISFSVGYANIVARGDGTGPIANIVDKASNAGILWVNSAGNNAQRHWAGALLDTDGDRWHEWSGLSERNTISLSPGATICAYLRWDSWPTTALDLDLYLYDSSLYVVSSSQGSQTGTQPPTEWLCYTSPYLFLTANYYIAVWRYAGSGNPRVDLEVRGVPSLQYPVALGSVTIPADAVNAFTVGAIDHHSSTSSIESFSSQGPTLDSRTKPDIAGPDGVTTAAYGSAGFFGTSAAAPHVAGAAALVKGANPSYAPMGSTPSISTTQTPASTPTQTPATTPTQTPATTPTPVPTPGLGPAGIGLLRVYSDPAVATTVIIDGIPRNDWGLDWLELIPGNYSLSFTGVAGYFSPTAISVKRCSPSCGIANDQPVSAAVTIRAGETTEVRVPFTSAGFLRVTAEGANSPTISIDGYPVNEWGAWVALAAGSHAVSFETIAGTTHPCDKAVALAAGTTVHVHGNYTTGSCDVV